MAVAAIPERPAKRRGKALGGRLCARDRMLSIRDTMPVLSQAEAEAIDRVVREMREASIGDPVSA